jgi:predicted O-linked N-acetylglucosamine transferase (SPINDLY family)
MKLNARLFETLARISSNAKVRVEFHFLPLVAIGLAHHELARTILRVLPGAVVHAQAPHVAYLESLRRCDLFLCPFPYGNMNSIVDAIGVGLPGVCLDGSEAHARADAALLAWAGLPPGLAAQTVEEYVAAAVRLIDDADWRAQCREIAVKCDLQRSFFQGDASQFCQAISNLIWPGTEGKSLPPSELE